MRKLAKAKIPPLSPKLPKRDGTERPPHDWLGIDANALPRESDYLESSEVKKQDQAHHPDPPAQQWLSLRNEASYDPQQGHTEQRPTGCPQPG
jgi:hypothetical protein